MGMNVYKYIVEDLIYFGFGVGGKGFGVVLF